MLEYLAMGMSNQKIAEQLGLKTATVKLHVSGVCKKLNVDNRTQAAVMAYQCGVVKPNYSGGSMR